MLLSQNKMSLVFFKNYSPKKAKNQIVSLSLWRRLTFCPNLIPIVMSVEWLTNRIKAKRNSARRQQICFLATFHEKTLALGFREIRSQKLQGGSINKLEESMGKIDDQLKNVRQEKPQRIYFSAQGIFIRLDLFSTFTQHFVLKFCLRGPMTLKFMILDSRPALAQKSIVSYALPSNLPAVTAASPGPFKIDKLSNRHLF